MHRRGPDQVSLQEFVSCASLVDDLHIVTWCHLSEVILED